jgi:hypothetical protein
MYNLGIVESAHNVVQAVHSLDMTQKGISQTGPFRSSTNQTGNISNVQIGWNNTGGFPQFAQPLEALVGDRATTFIGILKWEKSEKGKWPQCIAYNCAEGEILSLGRLLSQEIKE